MRWRLVAVAAAMVATSCVASADDPTAAVPASTTPATAATTTATASPVNLTLRLDPLEARASAVMPLLVRWDGGHTLVTGEDTTIAVPAIPVDLELRYQSIDGPAWRQVAWTPGEVVIRQPWRAGGSRRADGDIVMAWQAFGDTDSYREQLAAAPGLTVTSPLWWDLDEEGRLIGEADPDLVEEAHSHGIEVWPYVSNGFEWQRTRAALADPGRRRALALRIAAEAKAAGVDGVNLDFENFSPQDAELYTAFAAELTEAVHGWGGVVSVDVTAVQLATPYNWWGWAYDRRGLAESVDYMVLMAYDQFSRLSPKAGPVAAPEWVEEGIDNLVRYTDPHRIILGVPFYGRIWDGDPETSARSVGLGAVAELAAEAELEWDPEHRLMRAALPDGRFFWVEGSAGLEHRRRLVERYGLAGVAGWRLGLDEAAVWPVLAG